MVILYFFIFFKAKLYSDMGLQLVFVLMQVQGWYLWAKGSKDKDEKIVVKSLSIDQIGWTAVFLGGCTGALGYAMHQYTDASLPYLDAFTASISLAAQWWMNKQYLENWALWIVANCIYLYIYTARELYITTGLYAVFLVLAVIGWMEWKRKTVRSDDR